MSTYLMSTLRWTLIPLLLGVFLALPLNGQESAPANAPEPTTTETSPETSDSATNSNEEKASQTPNDTPTGDAPAQTELSSKTVVMLAGLTVFVLAIFVGFEIITKVPATLHTPLMSGSNAISGITLVGAVIVAGGGVSFVASTLGMVAVILATINVVGGFLVTHRMLAMFKKR